MPDAINKGEMRTMLCTIASATVIEAGDLVEVASGLIIKATATAAKIAYSPYASAVGDTVIEVSVGEVELLMDCEDAFAVTQKGGEYDITSSAQTINQSGTTYKVIMIDPSQDAGVVDATTDIKCKINKPLDERA